MAEIQVGQIIASAATGDPPDGFALCNGAVLPTTTYPALFDAIGFTYPGGNGTTTYALPDLRGCVIVGVGSAASGTTYVLAESGGDEAVSLTVDELAAHSHSVACGVNPAVTAASNPAGNLPGNTAPPLAYAAPGTGRSYGTMAASMIGTTGSGDPHENRQPYLSLNYLIATE